MFRQTTPVFSETNCGMCWHVSRKARFLLFWRSHRPICYKMPSNVQKQKTNSIWKALRHIVVTPRRFRCFYKSRTCGKLSTNNLVNFREIIWGNQGAFLSVYETGSWQIPGQWIWHMKRSRFTNKSWVGARGEESCAGPWMIGSSIIVCGSGPAYSFLAWTSTGPLPLPKAGNRISVEVRLENKYSETLQQNRADFLVRPR